MTVLVHGAEGGSEQPITYGALWRQAAAIGAVLGDRIRPRDTVAIMLRTEAAFFPTFFGVLLAGGVPVPIYPPFRLDRLEEYARRRVGILRNAGPRLLIAFREAERVAHLLRRRVPPIEASPAVEPLVETPPPSAMSPRSKAVAGCGGGASGRRPRPPGRRPGR